MDENPIDSRPKSAMDKTSINLSPKSALIAVTIIILVTIIVLILMIATILDPAIHSIGNTISTNSTANQLVISYQETFLAFISIAACLICIWLVFIFGRKLQLSASLRSNLVQSLAKQQIDAANRELLEKAKRAPLDLKTGDKPECWWFGFDMIYDPSYPYQIDSYFTPPTDTESPESKKTREDNLIKCKTWAKEERTRFEDLKQQAAIKAEKNADETVPKSMDISLLGGGFSFLLEFSAVIVIIFALLTLGILKVLDGKDITTILASIAGYVLGKAQAGQAGAAAKKEGGDQKIVEGKYV